MPSLRVGTLKNTAMKMFIKIIAANIMATIFQIRRERRFLIASCSFILDNCSATSLAVFSFSIFAPSNSLTDTSNISANRIRVSASGTDNGLSDYMEPCCQFFLRKTFLLSESFLVFSKHCSLHSFALINLK